MNKGAHASAYIPMSELRTCLQAVVWSVLTSLEQSARSCRIRCGLFSGLPTLFGEFGFVIFNSLPLSSSPAEEDSSSKEVSSDSSSAAIISLPLFYSPHFIPKKSYPSTRLTERHPIARFGTLTLTHTQINTYYIHIINNVSESVLSCLPSASSDRTNDRARHRREC